VLGGNAKCETDLNAFLSVFPASVVNICLTDCPERRVEKHFFELSPLAVQIAFCGSFALDYSASIFAVDMFLLNLSSIGWTDSPEWCAI